MNSNHLKNQLIYKIMFNIPQQVILQIQLLLMIAVIYRKQQLFILFMIPNTILVSITIQSIIESKSN
jgi:hypothetical protein